MGIVKVVKGTKRLATLILAYDMEDKLEPQDIFIFFAVHLPVLDLKNSVRDAFKDWAATTEGAKYIKENGCNWGDALQIPDKFLRYRCIIQLCALNDLNGGEKRRLIDLNPDYKLVVNHNEKLVP